MGRTACSRKLPSKRWCIPPLCLFLIQLLCEFCILFFFVNPTYGTHLLGLFGPCGGTPPFHGHFQVMVNKKKRGETRSSVETTTAQSTQNREHGVSRKKKGRLAVPLKKGLFTCPKKGAFICPEKKRVIFERPFFLFGTPLLKNREWLLFCRDTLYERITQNHLST